MVPGSRNPRPGLVLSELSRHPNRPTGTDFLLYSVTPMFQDGTVVG